YTKIGDIILSRVGSYGNTCFVNRHLEFCLGQNTVAIRPKIDSFYLYYCINSDLIKNQIESFVGGASQPTISLKNISNLDIPCPHILIQRKIAYILSVYDELIENNIRRIQIFEHMAKLIYNEWFIKK
ncbi:unnamed protein product, partial [marine sediment metagenome]